MMSIFPGFHASLYMPLRVWVKFGQLRQHAKWLCLINNSLHSGEPCFRITPLKCTNVLKLSSLVFLTDDKMNEGIVDGQRRMSR